MIIQSITVDQLGCETTDGLDNHAHVSFWLSDGSGHRLSKRVDGLEGQRVGNSSGSGQKLKMRSLNTQDVIQIHPAHNFVSFGRFGMYVVQNERPTLWLSFSVFYV